MQNDGKATASVSGFKDQFAAEAPHDRAGHVEAQTAGVSAALERAKEVIGIGNAGASILKPEHDVVVLLRDRNA